MRVSGKKAAIVLASKPETWVAKSVNSLPMAAFYMPLSGVESTKQEKTMPKQSPRFNTKLSAGVLCAVLTAAPLLTGLLSSPASAWSIQDGFENLTANCTSEVLNGLGTKDQLDNLVVSGGNLGDANDSAWQALPELEKYASVFRQYNNSLRSEWDDAGGETANTATQKAIAQKFVDTIKAAGFTIDENILDNFDASTSEKGALKEVYDSWLQAYPHLNDYMFLSIARGPFGEEPSFKEMFLGVVCSAKNIDPSFEVNYATSSNPFENKTDNPNQPSTGDNTGDNKPTTPSQPTAPTQPSVIESSDKNVKVSGLNININYILNVNLVSDQVKLTSNDFKDAVNQAFYDIFIRDNANNVISNTGKVEVSIKLPQGMNPKNDFVVYYVPTGANGEHLTDQAKAITGVKVSADGWLTFETDHFSVYGIIEYAKGKAPNTGIVAHNETSATTTGAKIAAGIVAVFATLGAAIVARKQILRKKASNSRN